MNRVLLRVLAVAALGLVVPLALIVTFLVVVNQLGHLRRRRISGDLLVPARPVATIIIPNWNGRRLLERCLPALVDAVEGSGGKHEILVVDNASTDDSVAFIREHFPGVRVLEQQQNLGFGGACNAGAQDSQNDIVVMLNNDMIVDRHFFDRLLDPFENPRTFAVAAQIHLWDPLKRREETGLTRGVISGGQLWVAHDEPPEDLGERNAGIRPILYAGGGSSAFDRRKFLALGGFDDLYHPFYGEDTDISYRAWKRGWSVVFEPRSIVYHKHRGTIGAHFKPEYIEAIVQRNHLLFVWKNVGDWRLLVPLVVSLPLRCAAAIRSGECSVWPLVMAIQRLPGVARRIIADRPYEMVSDRQALRFSEDVLAWREEFLAPRTVDRDEPLNVLFLAPYFPYPPAHGGAVRMYNVVKRLGQRHRVHLFSFYDSEEERVGITEMERYCTSVRTFLRRPELADHNPFGTHPLCVTEFESAAMRQAIEETLIERDVDVIQVDYTQMAHYVYPSRHWVNVLTEHDLSFLSAARRAQAQSWLLSKVRDGLGYLKMLSYELDACRRYDLVLTVTPRECTELLSYDPNLSVSAAAPTGVDAKSMATALDTDLAPAPNTLLFVGYFGHTPNVDAILYFVQETYPLIRQRIPEIRLTVVGKGAPPEVRALADDPSITIAGYVEDIRACYRQHAIFIAPIRYGAGVRVKIVEAMAAGIAVVSTTLGAEGIVCQPGRDLLVADSPADFAAAVLELLPDQVRRQEIAANGQRLALDRYDFDAIVQNLEQLYYEALVRRRASASPVYNNRHYGQRVSRPQAEETPSSPQSEEALSTPQTEESSPSSQVADLPLPPQGIAPERRSAGSPVALRRILAKVAPFVLARSFEERDVRRILLLKTGGVSSTLRVLAQLRTHFPEASIDLLTEEREFEPFTAHRDIARLHFYRRITGFAGIWLRTRREDYGVKAVLLTAEPSYGKLKILSFLLSARKMRAYNQHFDSQYIGFREPEALWAFIEPTVRWLLVGIKRPGFGAPWRSVLRRCARLFTRIVSAFLLPFTLLYLITRATLIHIRRWIGAVRYS